MSQLARRLIERDRGTAVALFSEARRGLLQSALRRRTSMQQDHTSCDRDRTSIWRCTVAMPARVRTRRAELVRSA
eukprot:3685642-Pleurochrysis_carterae.AAC.1